MKPILKYLIVSILLINMFCFASCNNVSTPKGFYICEEPYIYFVTGYEFDDGEYIEQRAEMKINDEIVDITIGTVGGNMGITFSGKYEHEYPYGVSFDFKYLSDGSMECTLLHPEKFSDLFNGKTSFVLQKVQ